MVKSHMIRSTTTPTITNRAGATLFPSPLDAAVALSIKAETQYDRDKMVIRIEAYFITFGSLVNRDKNGFCRMSRESPRINPTEKEYNVVIRKECQIRSFRPAPKFCATKLVHAV